MKDIMTAVSTLLEESDADIKKDISDQMGGRDVDFERVDISDIAIGDTVYHEGQVKTVSKSNLKKDDFMGPTLYGDSYNIGQKKVIKLILRNF